MFMVSMILLLAAIVVFGGSYLFAPTDRTGLRLGAGAFLVVAFLAFLASMFTTVPASHVAVVTTFGKIEQGVLTEGAHFIAPWSRTTDVYLGQQKYTTTNSEAGSKDLQAVHATLAVNYVIDPTKARDLYAKNPTLTYAALLLDPAVYETFKAVVAQYTAEELVTKRQEVSAAILVNLQRRMAQFDLLIQNVNLVNFGFSKSFDAAIEEKVTANQKAATAENNLKRVKFEADSRIAQAEGEAKAIAIQAAAVEKSGGVGYVQLQAIQKWDGKLPATMAGGVVPFVNVK